MSGSLKAYFLLAGHNWTLNEVCHKRKIDIKGEYSLSDSKNKEIKIFFEKKQLSNRFRIFLIVKFLMRPEDQN